MVGLQFTADHGIAGLPAERRRQLQHLRAGEEHVVRGIKEFFERYAKRAVEAKVDPLGFYLPPFNYAIGQMLEQAVNATKSLDQKGIADYLHENEMKTIVGPIRSMPTASGRSRAW